MTPRAKEVFKYMTKIERMNYAKSGVFGIWPSNSQIGRVFGFSKQRADFLVKSIREELDKYIQQK